MDADYDKLTPEQREERDKAAKAREAKEQDGKFRDRLHGIPSTSRSKNFHIHGLSCWASLTSSSPCLKALGLATWP